jgi:hypothetical protein
MQEEYQIMLDLVGVQEVRWDKSSTEKVGKYTLFYGKEDDNRELGKVFFVHKRIISAVIRGSSLLVIGYCT